MKHRSGVEVAVPAYISIRDDWQVHNPYSDISAQVRKGPVTTTLASLFVEGSAPHLHLMDKKGKVMASLFAEAERSLREKQKSAGARADVEGVKLVDHQQKRKAEALDKARAALKKKPDKRKRSFSFEDVVSVGADATT